MQSIGSFCAVDTILFALKTVPWHLGGAEESVGRQLPWNVQEMVEAMSAARQCGSYFQGVDPACHPHLPLRTL